MRSRLAEAATNGIKRFGAFEVDLRTGELRKQGLRLRLHDQPFQVLAALLERPGEVVTREDLIRRLWGDGTVVDFDRGLNTAVTRLRQALSDSAEAPRYIETVARRGYRFIGTAEVCADVAQAPLVSAQNRRPPALRWRLTGVALGLVATAFAGWWLLARTDGPTRKALRILPLATESGVERVASFSPDGTQIVYEWLQENEQRHLYIKAIGTGDPVALTSGAAAEFGPAWSPDGRLIAFIRQTDPGALGVFVIPPVGGVERKIAEIAAPPFLVMRRFYRRLDWTADGTHLIVSAPERPDGPEGLLLLSIETAEKAWLTRPSADARSGDREPAVSPDGRTVAFVRGEMAANEAIYLLPLTSDLKPAGEPRPLPSGVRGQGPAWTPDGKGLIFTGSNPGMAFGSGVSVVGISSQRPATLVPALGMNAAVLAVARSGRLAYSRVKIESSLCRQEVPADSRDALPPTRLIASSAADSQADYSPDGRRIAFASNRSGAREIWTCASDGSHCLQVTRFNGSFVNDAPRWSPDGKHIAFESAAGGRIDVYVVDAGGGAARRVTDDKTHGNVPSWSHDGKWIYFSSAVTGRDEVWKVPRDGGKPIQVTHSGGFAPLESPNSKALYYTKGETSVALFRSATDGNGETEILNAIANRGFALGTDHLYYLTQERDAQTTIHRLTLSSGEQSRIAVVERPTQFGLALSPNGRYLIYTQWRVSADLMLVENFN